MTGRQLAPTRRAATTPPRDLRRRHRKAPGGAPGGAGSCRRARAARAFTRLSAKHVDAILDRKLAQAQAHGPTTCGKFHQALPQFCDRTPEQCDSWTSSRKRWNHTTKGRF